VQIGSKQQLAHYNLHIAVDNLLEATIGKAVG
jgi:hypothetical protein